MRIYSVLPLVRMMLASQIEEPPLRGNIVVFVERR